MIGVSWWLSIGRADLSMKTGSQRGFAACLARGRAEGSWPPWDSLKQAQRQGGIDTPKPPDLYSNSSLPQVLIWQWQSCLVHMGLDKEQAGAPVAGASQGRSSPRPSLSPALLTGASSASCVQAGLQRARVLGSCTEPIYEAVLATSSLFRPSPHQPTRSFSPWPENTCCPWLLPVASCPLHAQETGFGALFSQGRGWRHTDPPEISKEHQSSLCALVIWLCSF